MTETVRPFEHEYHTQIKNCVLDEIMPRVSSSAWKVLCVVMRQTLGWTDNGSPTGRKEWDWISHSQFRKKTGIASDTTIAKALKECMAVKYILRHEIEIKGQDRYYYSLNRNLEIEIDTPHRKWGGTPTGNGDTKRNYTKERILSEPELVPTGEEFSPRTPTQRKIIRPGLNIKRTPLSPSTPGAEFMFAEIAKESTAQGRRAPKRFNTLAQKEMFENAEARVGEDNVKKFVVKAIAGGIPHIKGVTFYVNRCAQEKPRVKVGEVLNCDEWCEGMPPRLRAGETLIINAPPIPTSINPGG